MPRNGSGTMERIYSWVTNAAGDINIEPDLMDEDTDDIADELSNSLALDGQSTMTGNLKMGNNRVTGMAAGSARTDGANIGQVQDNAIAAGTAGGSSNAFTLTLSPAITAYSTHQQFTFIANFSITGATTIAVNGLAAKTIKKNGSEDLVTGDIVSGQTVVIIYDGTNFQIPNVTGQTLNQIYLANLYYS